MHENLYIELIFLEKPNRRERVKDKHFQTEKLIFQSFL
jgi:hypothetical protein